MMEGFHAITYGERVAEDYDQRFSLGPELTKRQVAVLSELHHRGRILEVGAGTGRIALPLAAAGKPVHAIDISPRMLSILHRKAAERQCELTTELMDISKAAPAGRFGLISCVFNTFYMLGGHEEQRRALANFATCIEPEGMLVIETWVLSKEQEADSTFRQSLQIRRLTPDEVVISAILVDRDDSRLDINDLLFTRDGIALFPHQAHYLSLDELDDQCREAGFQLMERWSDWDRTPYVDGITDVVSLYRMDSQHVTAMNQ
ncbi:class I SAM-dependent methyltransferase [Nonomuraea sp. SMC257]|uniref:Class I SAM-dependent methyltransferase n=1 Tax=Nonomuraea montanisoli TaxID=2741721 RepID=A0A7Y6IA97_9ACTN|nr:class I SAM-dependent methyltransferase [Nonomuraea montanisoli]NUW34557.1 class I SAM-dependent methyltransferase [Nonomuraea montanisoli]